MRYYQRFSWAATFDIQHPILELVSVDVENTAPSVASFLRRISCPLDPHNAGAGTPLSPFLSFFFFDEVPGFELRGEEVLGFVCMCVF